MNPAGGQKKRVGRPKKEDDPNEDPKKKANRLRQTKYRQKVGKQIGEVVDDLDDCDEERAVLKVEKTNLQDKVKGLTDLLKTCDDQVKDILKAVNGMPKMAKAKSAPPPPPAGAGGVKGKEAGKMINMAMKGKIARNKMKEAEKQRTFDILLR
jgi:hypothetical protein